MEVSNSPGRRLVGERLLGAVERAGNVLPHPVWLFAILTVALGVVSLLLAAAGISATRPDGEVAPIKSLISAAGIRFAFTSVVGNFMSFPTLGPGLVALLGLALADRVGLISAFLRHSLAGLSPRFATPMLAFTGSIAHVAADAGYLILIPLGGIIFRALGRNPITGTLVAYVALSGGSSASPILIPNDIIYSGLTTAAAQTVDGSYVMSPLGNFFFTAVSSLVLTCVITVVVDGYLAPRIDRDHPHEEAHDGANRHATQPDNATGGQPQLTIRERMALRNAGIAAVAFVALTVLSLVPAGSPMRGENGGVIDSVPIRAIAVFISLFFAISGTVYGLTIGRIQNSADIPDLVADGLKDVTPLLVLFFVTSQFLAYFNWSNIGILIATRGAGVLESANAPAWMIFGGMLVIVSLMNLWITSGSAQWALVSPIFVPMFMLLDIRPETTTALYRIADSCTNILTPVNPYFAMCVAILQRYKKAFGIGTLFSMTLPLAAAMFTVWSLLFALWYVFGLPLGPAAPIR